MAKPSPSPAIIRIRLARSPLGRKPRHRRTLAALGLHRVGRTVEHAATDEILGMVKQVSYLLSVEQSTGEES